MKRTILFTAFIISMMITYAQNSFTEAFDNVFRNISRTDTAVGVHSEAQSPYRVSLGGVVYGNALGPSLKVFLTNNIAIQTDILYKGVITGCTYNAFILYFLLETSTNVFYQKKFKEKDTYELCWLMGGGVSLGFQFNKFGFDFGDGNGKFGINAIMGFELCAKKIPLTFQMDFRPGYALLFNSGENLNTYGWWSPPNKNPWSHFEWLIAFTFRYKFKNK